jgi:hypothetical protein
MNIFCTFKYATQNNTKKEHFVTTGGQMAINTNVDVERKISLKKKGKLKCQSSLDFRFYTIILSGISFLPVLLIKFSSQTHLTTKRNATHEDWKKGIFTS